MDEDGGDDVFWGTSADCPPEVEEAFLDYVRRFEETEPSLVLGLLAERGWSAPRPDSLSDEDLPAVIERLAEELALLRIFLHSTDHLSDRALYSELYRTLETEPLMTIDDPDSTSHYDLVGSGSEEDVELWLRYYADDETRADWASRYPEYDMPPAELPPYPRQHRLPSCLR